MIFELFSTTNFCSLLGLSQEIPLNNIPSGSKLIVVANPCQFFWSLARFCSGIGWAELMER